MHTQPLHRGSRPIHSQGPSQFSLFQYLRAGKITLVIGSLFWLVPSSDAQTTWLGGTGNWNNGAIWSAGVPNSTSNAFVDTSGGTSSTVNVNVFGSVKDLTIDFGDLVNINNGQRLSIHGSLFNNGLVRFNSTGGANYLQTVGTTVFSGTGVVELTGSQAWLYDNNNPNAASDHLINSSTHTIRGAGNIGLASTLQITNQGLMDANVAGGTLNVTPNASGMNNTGTLRASNGGNLNLVGTSLGGGVIHNAGGTIEAGVGSTVTHNTATRGIVGGQLTGPGTHLIGNSWARFDSLAVNAFVDITNGNRLDALGTINNNNLIRINSTGANTYLQTVGTTTLTGNGVVQLTGPQAWLYDNANGNAANDHLINSSTHTIRGAGNIGFASTLQITNQGLMDANVAGGTLNVTPNASGMNNTGTLRATNGGTMMLLGSSHGGTGNFEALNGSQLMTGPSAVANNVSAGGVLTSGTWRAIDGGSGATLRIQNNATALINTVGPGAVVDLSGANSRFTVRAANVTLDSTLNTVQGSLTLRNGRVMNLAGGLTHSGSILVDGSASVLGVASNYLQTGGNLNLNAGTVNLAGALNQATGGLIAGTGSINGDFVFNGTAVLDPGFSPGRLDFGNDLTWGTGGRIRFELGVDALASDFIDVGGDLLKTGAGTRAFTFADNGWVAGRTYDLVEFGSTNFSLGDFAWTNGGGFSGSFGFNGNRLQFTLQTIRNIDFSDDGNVGCADVDALVAEIAAGTNMPRFDLDFDGNVDTADLQVWLSDAGALNLPSGNSYLVGDANLDGVVDGSDFGLWNSNKFTNVAAWCSGDFSADGSVDGSDFGLWNANKFTSALTTSLVPEPAGAMVFVTGALWFVLGRRTHAVLCRPIPLKGLSPKTRIGLFSVHSRM